MSIFKIFLYYSLEWKQALFFIAFKGNKNPTVFNSKILKALGLLLQTFNIPYSTSSKILCINVCKNSTVKISWHVEISAMSKCSLLYKIVWKFARALIMP